MDGLEIKLALLALADATEQIGDRFAATAYDTETTSWSKSNFNVRTQLITAPTEDFKDKHLNSFKAHGYTPTSSGIEDGRSISDITPNSEDVIIVITDGVANIDREGREHNDDNYQNPAMKEAGDQVATATNEGKRVIGLGVGEYLSDDAMSEIFGNDYFRADMDEISDTLVEIYRRQMETA
jgi:Mg-chelatase subunit ChlD